MSGEREAGRAATSSAGKVAAGKPTFAGIVEHCPNRVARAFLVRTDDAVWAALDPSGDVSTGHLAHPSTGHPNAQRLPNFRGLVLVAIELARLAIDDEAFGQSAWLSRIPNGLAPGSLFKSSCTVLTWV